MIHSARFTKGWPLERLPAFKEGHKFTFGKGVTIAFGPNGCGKSTLLRLLGAMSSCPDHGGWSGRPDSLFLEKDDDKRGTTFPQCLIGLAHFRDDVDAEVDWDGMPTFMHLAHESDKPMIAMGMPHDVLDDGDQLNLLLGKASAGQNRTFRLNKVLEKVIKGPYPDLLKLKPKWDGDDETTRFVKYVKSLPRKGPLTLLLDEPERSLDVVSQALFWQNVVPFLSRNFQTVIATHSPFSLSVEAENVAYLDMDEGYLELCRETTKKFFSGKELPIDKIKEREARRQRALEEMQERAKKSVKRPVKVRSRRSRPTRRPTANNYHNRNFSSPRTISDFALREPHYPAAR